MEIHPDEPVSACRSCGAAIVWRKTEAGKMMPVAVATGINHFADCPQGKGWSKSKAKTVKPKPEAADEPLPW